jgi:hypothetical protein
MLIAEIMMNIFTSISFSIYLLCSAATVYLVKNGERVEIEEFWSYLSNTIIHWLAVAPFYLT